MHFQLKSLAQKWKVQSASRVRKVCSLVAASLAMRRNITVSSATNGVRCTWKFRSGLRAPRYHRLFDCPGREPWDSVVGCSKRELAQAIASSIEPKGSILKGFLVNHAKTLTMPR